MVATSAFRLRHRTLDEEFVNKQHELACSADPKTPEEMEREDSQLVERADLGLEDECVERENCGEF